MKKGTIILTAIIATYLISCKKNAADAVSSSLDFQLAAVNPSSTVNRAMATITWSSGYANVNQIKFEAKQNGSETEFKSSVHAHVDLFAAASTIGSIHLPTGTFEEVEFKIEAAASGNDAAFQLQGNVNGIPVVLKVDKDLEIKSEQSQVTLSGADIALNKIDLSGLTAGLSTTDISGALQTNGTIVISSSSNARLFNAIFSNLQRQHETDVEVRHGH